jgi:hypothetical protein
MLREVNNNRQAAEILGEGGFEVVNKTYSKKAVIQQYTDLVSHLID